MAVGFSNTNKPLNPRGQDASPKGYNRASLFSGKALDFDGVNDYIQADGVNETLDNYTLSWNLKTTSTQNYSNIFSNSTNLIDIYIMSNGQLRFYTDQGYNSTNLPPVNDGQWKNLVLSISGTSLNIYVNGVLSETLSITDVSRSIANIRLGYIFSNLYAFNGEMAGFKIFNTALTTEQVADLYNNPEKVVPTGVDNTALKLWLPMMEGAGTTAYDGSGNGNHGTISGATYVNGIGAPVAQSAVMDWNKGTNLLDEYSEDFSNSGWLKEGGSSISASLESNPYGKQTWEFEVTDISSVESQIRGSVSGALSTSTDFKTIVIAKAGTLNWLRVRNLFTQDGTTNGNAWFNLSTGSVGTVESSQTATMTDLGDGWYKCEVSGTSGSTIVNRLIDIALTDADGTKQPSATGKTGLLVLSSISLNGIYVETLGTAQTSDVLLPQGLTTGRDITGVNLFKNVRKQGALNLDGNSWAEVHDNESLDFGTGSFTLEAWVKNEYINTLSSYNVILNLGNTLGASAGLTSGSGYIAFFYGPLASNYSASNDGSWVHIVGTYDGTNATIYANGVQESQAARTAIDVSTNEIKYIGKDSNISRTYKDQIAQPRIYNRALTASEIQQNYNSGKNTYK